MSTAASPVRRRVQVGAIAAGIALALIIPVIAAAANTASFSSRTPASGSSSTNTRPTISVSVYDRYGAHGAGAIALTLDGQLVTPAVVYTVTGHFNPATGYRRFKVSYRPPTALALGSHTVTVRIHDVKGKISTTSWSFTVKAPYKATFSSVTPADGSSSSVSTPTISVVVYDKYGVSSSSAYFSMTLDGVKQTPVKMTRYSGSGTTKFKLSFAVTPSLALSLGSHTVVATVKDVKALSSSYTWSFTVVPYVAPPLPDMPVSIAATSCATCHVGYPAAHPMDQCPLCHGPGRPVSGSVYTTADVSAHTAACAAETPCHGGGGAFPHSLWSNCALCHNGHYSGIPATHGATQTVVAHASTSTFCTQPGCHSSSLTVEHYNHTVGGVRLSCATCHESTDASVTAAIADGSTACEDCHDVGDTTTHPGTTAHVISGDCAIPGCHVADPAGAANVAVIHTSIVATGVAPAGCVACHGTGVIASTTCSACHASNTYHAGVGTLHAIPATDTACVEPGCHSSSDVSLVHAQYGFGCATCHASTDASVTAALAAGSTACESCHTGVPHTDDVGLHLAAVTACDSAPQCHSVNVIVIHQGDCADCHGPGMSPSTVCSTCHGTTVHSNQAADHVVSNGCTGTDCHNGADVAAIHDGDCSDCHANPDGHPASTDCTTCHIGFAHDLPAVHAATMTTIDITINGNDYGPMACSACHPSNDLRTIHSGDCAACHTKPVDTTLGGTWNKGCVQGGCHSSSGANPYHGSSVDAAHDTTPGVTTNCGGSGCHGDVSDVAIIHASHGGCADCHGASAPHAASVVCSDCHPDTPHDLVALHDATGMPSGDVTITINGNDYATTGCSECHTSSDLRTLHGGDTGCANCHPNPANQVLGTWNGTCTQAGCHSADSTMTVAQHAGVNSAHDTSSAVTTSCGSPNGPSCHGDVSDAAVIHANHGGCADCHANANHAASLDCSVCHTPHALPAVHAATMTTVDITINGNDYGPMACTSCHPSNDLPTIHASVGGCTDCHTTPADTTPVDTILGGTWNHTCTQGGCHNGVGIPYHGAGNPVVDLAHTTPSSVTTSCGGPNAQGLLCHGNVTDVAVIHASHGGCADCHGPSAPAPASLVCSDCHDVPHDLNAAHASNIGSTSATITINTIDYGPESCSMCHPSSDLQTIHRVGHSTNCIECHATDPDVTLGGPWLKGCAQGNCHQGTSPVPMHGSVSTMHDTPSSVTTSCGGPDCHGTVTDVAVIHSAVTGHGANGCGVCHDGSLVATPTLDCSVCHPNAPGQSTPHDLAGLHAVTFPSGNITFTVDGTDYGTTGCSECHTSADLRTLHGGDDSCTSCHPNPFSTIGHGNWNGTCTQGGCHSVVSTLTAQQHTTTVNGAHTTGADVTASCGTPNGPSCHGDLGNNVAAIHAAHGGCADCHGAGAPHAASLVCSDCHTSHDNVNYVSLHNATLPAGGFTITINGTGYGTTGCTECHSGSNLIGIHQTLGGCTDCHTTPPDTTPVTTILGSSTWNGTCTQGGCHSTVGVPYHGTGSSGTDSAHTLDTTPTCVGSGCHSAGVSGKDVAAIHAAVPGRTDNGCGICHDGTLVSAPTTNCAAATGCHSSGEPATHGAAAHAAIVSTGTITILGVAYTDESCSACHSSLNLQTIHGGDSGCINCHPNPASTIGHGNWDGTCTQGGCHSSESTLTVQMHHDADTAHTLDATPGCIASGCHSAGASGRDVAALHSVVTSYAPNGCGICHDGTLVSTPTTNCASPNCHPSGAPADTHGPAEHTATLPSGTITFTVDGTAYGTTGCSECHTSTNLQTLHGGDSGCINCHPNPANQVLGTWDHTCTQAGCHSVTSTMTVAQHTYVVNGAHDTSTAVASCGTANGSSCHSNVTNAAVIHDAGGTGPGCAACHGAAAPAPASLVCSTCHAPHNLTTAHATALGSMSATITINHVSYGTYACTTCHSLDLRDIHESTCADCHTTPGGTALGGTWDHACDQCHTPVSVMPYHGGPNSTINASHTLDTTPTCIQSGCHTGGRDVAAIHSVVTGHGANGCGVCHDGSLVATPTLNCASANCHPGGGPGVATPPVSHGAAAHAATVTTGTITILGVAYTNRSCSDCHPSLNLQTIHGGDSGCANCHPDPASTIGHGNWNGTCTQGGCHSVESTLTVNMHHSVDASHTLDTTPTCIASGCHTGGAGGRDVAAIHSVVAGHGTNGCGVCHDGSLVATPTLNCASANCHPGGGPGVATPPASHASHISTVTAGDITIDGNTYTNIACASCHGNASGNTQIDLQLIPGHDGVCSTCHPTPAGSVTPGDFTCNQSGCHSGTTTGTAQVQHANLNTAHSVDATTCTQPGCHAGSYNGGSDVAKIHSVVTGHGANGCGVCHDGSLVATPTTNCGGSSNCHPGYPTMPAAHSSHIATVTSGVMTINGNSYGSHTCSDCHGNSGSGNSQIDLQLIPGHPASNCAMCHASATNSAPVGDFTCTAPSCHGTGTLTPPAIQQHANITSAHLTTAGVSANCGGGSCHGTFSDVATIHNAVTGHGANGCGVCHDGSLVATPTLNCASPNCHPTYPTPSASHGSHAATVTAGVMTINGTSYGSHNCTDCHGNTSGNSRIDLQLIQPQHGGVGACSTCHAAAASSAPRGDFTCTSPNCHGGGTLYGNAIAQHANINGDHNVTAQTCTVAGCHTGAYNGGSDIAAIHNVANANKCDTCHTPSSTPTSTCTVSGCHNSGSAYPMLAYSASDSSVPHTGEVAGHDAAVYNDCNSGCHETCDGCHPGYGEDQPGDYSMGGDVPSYHAGVHNDDDFGVYTNGCLTCHTPGTANITDCTNCHDINGAMSADWPDMENW